MAKYTNTVEYQLRTTLDSSGISKLQSELQALSNQLQTKFAQGIIPKEAFTQTMSDIKQVQTALTTAFNGKLGMMDLQKFHQGLTAGGKTLNSYYQTFSALGSQGTRAFGQLYGQLTKIDTGMRQVSSTSDKIMNTLGNTVRWGLIASGFSQVMNSMHQAVQYVQELDDSLTQIMLVTDYSKQQMNEYAKSANEAAKALGNTTTGVTNGTLVFAQQGYDLNTSQTLANASIKLANASQQDSAETSDQITALMNSYKIPAQEVEKNLDKLAQVANVSAADVEELATAMKKSASTANTVGVTLDQLNAQIATIESVTREAPENIGNGLKTIYARFSDIKIGDTLEDGVNLGQVTSTLEKVGVEVVDAQNNMRAVGDIMEDLMEVWSGLDLTQKSSIATTLAGKFQLSRFNALMNSSDLYKDYLTESENAEGTLDKMQEEYFNSLEGRLNKLQASVEGVFVNAFETDDFYDLIDAVTRLVELFDELVQGIGGGTQALTAFAAIATRTMSKSIGSGVKNFVLNRQTTDLFKTNKQQAEKKARERLYETGGTIEKAPQINKMTETVAQMQKGVGSLNQEEVQHLNEQVSKYISIATEAQVATTSLEKALKVLEVAFSSADDPLPEGLTLMEKYGETLQKLKNYAADGAPIDAEWLRTDDLMQAMIKDSEDLSQKLAQMADRFNLLTKSGKNLSTNDPGFKKWKEEAIALNTALKQVQSTKKLDETQTKNLETVIKLLTKVERDEIISTKEFSQAVFDLNVTEDQFIEVVKELINAGTDFDKVLEQLIQDYNTYAGALKVAQKESEGLAQALSFQSMAEGVTRLASGVTSVVFAWQAWNSAIEAFHDTDLSSTERFEQGVLGISMAISMSIPAILDFTKLLKTAKTSILEYIAVKNLLSAAEIKTLAEEGKLTLAEIARIITEKQLSKASTEVAGATALEGASAGAAVTPTMLLGTALKGLAVSAVPFLAIAAPLVALIAGIGYAIKTNIDNVYAYDNALDQASDTAAQSTQAYEAQKSKLEELNSAIETINGQEDAFEGLTKGTQEWTDALVDLNTQVMDLVNSMPELAKYLEVGPNGEITLNKEGLEKAKEEQQERVTAAQLSKTYSDENKREAELKRQANEEGDKLRDKGILSSIGFGESAKQAEEVQVNSLTNFAKAIAEGRNDKAHAANSDLYDKYMGASPDEDVVRAIDNLVAKIQENKAENLGEEKVAATSALAKNENYQNATNLEQKIAVSRLSQDLKQGSNAYETAKANVEETYGGDINAIKEAYAKQQGYEYDSVTQKMTDSEGNEVGEDLTQEAMTNALIAADIMTNTTLEDKVPDLQGIEDQIGSTAADALQYDNEGNPYFDFSNVTSMGEIYKLVDTLNDAELSEDQLSQMKFSSAEAFAQAIQEGLNNANITIENTKLSGTNDLNTDNATEMETYLQKNTDLDKDEYDTLVSTRLGEKDEETGTYEGQQAFDKNSQGYKKEVEKATQEVKDAEAQYGKESDQYKTAQKALENLNDTKKQAQKDTKRYEDSVKQAAAAEARASKTVKEMTSHFKDNAEAIKKGKKAIAEGQKATEEYAKAVTQTKKDLAGLLDVNEDDFSDSFATSAKTLGLMEKVMNGDQEALQDLRSEAAKDIIVNLDLEDDKLTEEAQTALTGLISFLDSQDLGVDADVNLNDQEYVNKLNEMIKSGQIASEDISKALSAAGYQGQWEETDGYIETKTIDYKTTEKGSSPVGGLKVTDSKGNVSNALTFSATDVQMTQQETGSKKVPTKVKVLKGATQKSGVTGGGSSGGGGGGGGGCFLKNTLITTLKGYQKIENIQKWDIVLSYNEEKQKNEYSIVLETMKHNVNEYIYNLYIKEEILQVTGIHRFFIKRKENIKWIQASKLKIKDFVLLANGQWEQIQNITKEKQKQTVYNFEVSNNHNYYVGKNQILAHNKGSSGSSSSPAKVTKKSKTDTKGNYDPFQKVNQQIKQTQRNLDQISHNLEFLQKKADKITGKELLKNLQKQNIELKKSITNQKDLIKYEKERRKIAAEELAKTLTKLKAKGITDKNNDGILDNYKKVYLSLEKDIEKLRKRYNSFKKETKAAKKVEKKLEKAIEKRTELEELISEYEEYYDIISEIDNSLNDIAQESWDNYYSIIDNNVTIFEKWLDTADNLKNTLTTIQTTIKTIGNLDSLIDDTHNYIIDFKADQEILSATLDRLNGTNNQASWEEQWKTLNENASLYGGKDSQSFRDEQTRILEGWSSDIQQLKDSLTTLDEDMTGHIEQQNNLLLKQLHKHERVLNQIEQAENIVENTQQGTKRINALIELNKERFSLDKSQLDYIAIGLENLKSLKNEMEEQGLTNTASYQNLIELIEEQEDSYSDILNELIETAKQIEENQVELNVTAIGEKIGTNYTFDSGLSGDVPLDYLKDDWETIKQNAELYLDDVDKAYEIQKLQLKYTQLLDGTKNLNTQKKITNLMNQQLESLRKQDKLTQNQVDHAKAQLEVLQKQIALEDAQANKNQMQLKRDSQGNYRYVYTANQNAISQAEEALLDAQKNIYDLSKNQTIEAQDNIFNAISQFQDRLKNINEFEWTDSNAKKEAIQNAYKDFQNTITAYQGMLSDSQQNILNDFKNMGEKLFEENISDNLEKALSEDNLTLEYLDTIDDRFSTFLTKWIGDGRFEEWSESLQDNINGIKFAIDEYSESLEKINPNLTDTENLIDKINKNLQQILNIEDLNIFKDTLISNIKELIPELNNFNKSISEVAKQQTALQKSNSSYNQASSETISNMEKDTKNETDILTDQESNAEQKEIVDEAKEAAEEYEKQATRSLFEDQFAVRKARIIKKKKVTGTDLDRLVKFIEENNMQNKKGYTKKALLSKIAGWKNISWKEVIQAAKDASSYPKAKYRLPLTYNNKAFNAAFKEVFLFNSTEGTREWRAKVKRMKKYQSYNTGGYTGEWSDGSRDGRLAMLHQKELVLNANDTQHILDAVDIVRDIVETLKGSSLTSSLGTLSSGRYFNNSNNPIEQRVSIEATFPNATSADEIERALLSLSDSAFQYAYKTRD